MSLVIGLNTLLVLMIILGSGISAGLIYGTVNLILVEPYLDEAIGLENQKLFQSGQAEDNPSFWRDFENYRTWQKQGEVIAGGILGLSIGSLYGLIFVYSRHLLPSHNYVKKALVLAGIMWLTIYLIPFLKYPANPPTVGDPETIMIRSTLYVSFIALSGLGAFGFSRIYKKLKDPSKKMAIPLVYALFISVIFVIMPENPDQVIAPTDLLLGFRFASAITMTTFWILNGLIFGILWQKFQYRIEKNQFT